MDHGAGGPDLGTAFAGKITERKLADGRARVSIVLHTTKALSFVIAFESLSFPVPEDTVTLFGALAQKVTDGAQPALADSVLNVDFINTKPGAPLPDLVQLLFAPEPEQELLFLLFNATAVGTFTGSTEEARLRVQQVAPPSVDQVNGPYPVESIVLRPLGH